MIIKKTSDNKLIIKNPLINTSNGFNCKIVLSAPSKEAIDNYINLISKTINQTSIKIIWLPKKKIKNNFIEITTRK